MRKEKHFIPPSDKHEVRVQRNIVPPPPRYMNEKGDTTAEDPDRMLWYSARCTYWTDNWAKLITVGPGIPACPHCKSVGLQTTWAKWWEGAKAYEEQGPEHAWYRKFLTDNKEYCGRVGLPVLHKLWREQKGL